MNMNNEHFDALVIPDRRETERMDATTLERVPGKAPEHATLHSAVTRMWGCYEDIASGERFRVKRITVNPGAKLPPELHHHRAEHWVVVCGSARAVIGDTILFLTENQATSIPAGAPHRLENPGRIPLQIVEIQSGPYLAEDDAMRIDGPYQLAGIQSSGNGIYERDPIAVTGFRNSRLTASGGFSRVRSESDTRGRARSR
ncbi:MAG: cupin domain-containing protein [Prolixibacteraceae bacterium]|nr:cupin domain-containing protein [Burkholderiales bacterium]